MDRRGMRLTGTWKNLHNEELHNLHSLPGVIRISKSRRMRWEGHIAYITEIRNSYSISMGKLKGKRPLGRPRYRWVGSIKIDLRETG
jgi:hypothetical protein